MKKYSILLITLGIFGFYGNTFADSITDALVSSYNFDGNLLDSGENGNDFTSFGSIDYINNEAVDFDGLTNYITASLPTFSQGFTISGSYLLKENTPEYLSSVTFNQAGEVWDTLFSRTSSYCDGLQLMYNRAGKFFRIYGNSSCDGIGTIPYELSNDTYYNIDLTYTGSLFTLYINGELIGTVSYAGNLPQQWSLSIGRNHVPQTYYLHGSIDSFDIYNRALSSEEIASLYDDEVSDLESILSLIEDTIVIVDELDKNIFKKQNRKKWLLKKLQRSKKKIQKEKYAKALKIITKVYERNNGCATTGAADTNDVIISCGEQEQVFLNLYEIQEGLENLVIDESDSGFSLTEDTWPLQNDNQCTGITLIEISWFNSDADISLRQAHANDDSRLVSPTTIQWLWLFFNIYKNITESENNIDEAKNIIDGWEPAIVSMEYSQNEDDFFHTNHAMTAYSYKEYINRIVFYVADSNQPGELQTITYHYDTWEWTDYGYIHKISFWSLDDYINNL